MWNVKLARQPLLAAFNVCAIALSTFSATDGRAADRPQAVQACEDISQALSSIHGEGTFSGLAILAKEGEPLCSTTHGYALAFEKAPFVEKTRFRIASVSKQFSAAVLLRLMEEGKVNLDDVLSDYLPAFKGKPAANVPIRRLLDHSSGIVTDSNFPTPIDVRNDPQKFAEAILDAPMEFEPGSRFEYNNSAYKLIGLIIEELTGLDYGAALSQYLFEPLGLENTGTLAWGEIVEGVALGYDLKDGAHVVFDPYEWGQPYSAGMMYSTAGDLALWNDALYGGDVFENDETLNEMTRPRLDVTDDIAVAYGLFTGTDPKTGLRWISHQGEFGAFRTLNTFDRDRGISVVMFSNVMMDEDDFDRSIDAMNAAVSKIPTE